MAYLTAPTSTFPYDSTPESFKGLTVGVLQGFSYNYIESNPYYPKYKEVQEKSIKEKIKLAKGYGLKRLIAILVGEQIPFSSEDLERHNFKKIMDSIGNPNHQDRTRLTLFSLEL